MTFAYVCRMQNTENLPKGPTAIFGLIFHEPKLAPKTALILFKHCVPVAARRQNIPPTTQMQIGAAAVRKYNHHGKHAIPKTHECGKRYEIDFYFDFSICD